MLTEHLVGDPHPDVGERIDKAHGERALAVDLTDAHDEGAHIDMRIGIAAQAEHRLRLGQRSAGRAREERAAERQLLDAHQRLPSGIIPVGFDLRGDPRELTTLSQTEPS